ncbi:hypothetical protein Bp8pS_116 [Bacillus phage vB_BpuM-BpSp]|nr:hypothetical protein Bp8pS_116 [Bacillus phage vB_BpuM-BpSp]
MKSTYKNFFMILGVIFALMISFRMVIFLIKSPIVLIIIILVVLYFIGKGKDIKSGKRKRV